MVLLELLIKKSDSSDKLKKILKKISYRGPDETGIVKFANITIGMNRLSIIDSKKHVIPYYDDKKKFGQYLMVKSTILKN